MDSLTLCPIARIHTDLPQKFGVPRQSGLVEALEGEVIFEPEYRRPEALRGLEGFSYLWLIWGFSKNKRAPGTDWSPTVRPPRLGGNTRLGVFATRSPFRPNPLGLSCVRLASIDLDGPDCPILRVTGADLADGTPIYDVKPYLPYADSKPDALGGFAPASPEPKLTVEIPPNLLSQIPEQKRPALLGVLAQDPRPSYQSDPDRLYGLTFAGLEVRFQVTEGRLTVVELEKSEKFSKTP